MFDLGNADAEVFHDLVGRSRRQILARTSRRVRFGLFAFAFRRAGAEDCGALGSVGESVLVESSWW